MKDLICKKIIELQSEFVGWTKNDERFGFSASPVDEVDRKYEFLFCPKEIDFKKDDPKDILRAIINSFNFSLTVSKSTVYNKINGINVSLSFEEFIETFDETKDFLKIWVKHYADQHPKRMEA